MKATSDFPDFAFRLLAERAVPRLRNPSPVLVLPVLVAGGHDALRSTGIESRKAMIRSADRGRTLLVIEIVHRLNMHDVSDSADCLWMG